MNIAKVEGIPANIQSAHCVVFASDMEVLLLQRGGTSQSRVGQWESPGGKVGIQQGEIWIPESHEVASLRETWEETGLFVVDIDLNVHRTKRPLHEGTGTYRQTHRLALAPSKNITLGLGHSGYIWTTIAEALESEHYRPLTSDCRSALEYYREKMYIVASAVTYFASAA